MNVTLKSYLVLFATKYRLVLQILSSYTRVAGRFFDVVWCDLSVTFTMGRLHSYFKTNFYGDMVILSTAENRHPPLGCLKFALNYPQKKLVFLSELYFSEELP